MIAAVSVAAAILTTGSFLPQARRTLRTRSTDDFAWGYLVTFSAGLLLWCVYGAIRGEVALFVANIVTLAIVLAIVSVKRTG